MSLDPTIWHTARGRMPLPRLMQHMGDGEHSNKTAHCPFCKHKDKSFGVFKDQSGKWRFKCHKDNCVANNPPPEIGHGEIGYIALRKNLGQKEAALEFLKLAVPDVLEAQEREHKKKKGADASCSQTTSSSRGSDDAAEGSSPPPAPPPPPRPEPKNVWDALYRKLILTLRDRTKLHGRGLSDATIDTLGFKSNNQSNRIHVESLKNDFTMELLLETGIFKKYKSGIGPNLQLLGWGLKSKACKEGDDDKWDWTEPILIPYLKDDGTCFYIRPHKGAITGSDDDEDDDEPTCSSHVYCPFLLANLPATREATVILTEGEFKAAAVFQCGIPVIAIPGVSFVRNPAFRAELLAIIRRFGITDLIIVFDNEVKDDPAFPSRYKPDPADRYDTAMWAEYIAIDLGREHFGPHKGHIRIGVLPDNLREDGKVDFDSALSYFVRQRRDVTRGTNEALKVFQKVIEDARPWRQARDLFPSEARRITEWKLQRLFYKPHVPSGGDKELRFANQCQAAGEVEVAGAYRSVIGCYYERKKLTDQVERKLALEKAQAANRAVEQAKSAGLNGSEIDNLKIKARAAWEFVHGLPIAISDFTMTCHFKLYKTDGKAIRLVTIRNRNDRGKSDGRLYRLTGAEMARGPEFMRWCYDTGRADWRGGYRLLSELCEDLDHQSYMRDIYEVNYYGYHAQSGIWFFGDCAFSPQGDVIEADKSNIFWHGGIGYQIDSSIDERGTTFEQGAPLMLSPHACKPEERDVAELFHGFCVDMFSTIGGYDAWLMLGLVFAYAAAPELVKRGGHPSPWLFGKMSGGKTTIARWIMRIWGFKDLSGVGIDDRTTPVGMNRFLAQYSCLPVWFDEYRSNHNDPQKEAVLRGAFDRNSGAKGLADHSNRTRSAKIYTSPIVTGEASSSDAATRSRYGHINVSDRRRMGDGVARYAKVQGESKFYYLVGRFLMENRPKFVKNMLELCENWMNDPIIRTRIVNERVRFVYGTAWSAFIALSRRFTGVGAVERTGMEPYFREELLKHGEQALQDVFSETFLTRFWADVLSALQRGKINKDFFRLRTAIRLHDGRLKEASPHDDRGEQVLYIAHKLVFDEYARDLHTRGQSPRLELGDLEREMRYERYWIPRPKGGDRVHRCEIKGAKVSCWVVSLEKYDNGKYLFPSAKAIKEILIGSEETEKGTEDGSVS